MNDSIEPLLALHRKFCEASGSAIDPNDLRFHKHFSRYYWEFQREGFTAEEMVMVIRYVQAQNKKATAPEYRRKILPSKILGDLTRFCEDLAEAKRLEALKNKRATPRQQAINEFRGFREPEQMKDAAQSVRQILREATR